MRQRGVSFGLALGLLLSAALTLSLSLVLPGGAVAQNLGLYIAPKYLASFQNTGTVSNKNLGGFGMGQYGQFSSGGALAVGFDFYDSLDLPLRVEVEGALRGSSENTWQGSTPGGWQQMKGRWNTSTLFANLYWDFRNSTAFTPYVGVGVGMAFQTSEYKASMGGVGMASFQDSSTHLALNAGGGVSYAFTENFAADIGYRFVSTTPSEASFTTFATHSVTTHPYINEGTFSLRCSF